ncbi:MAG: FkbM family methyltransferase [Nitrosomonas sp.]|nr:FkbM family methyltransferase [Nitrosomonas sp.]
MAVKNWWIVERFRRMVLAFYILKGGYKMANVRGQVLKMSVDHWRVLWRINNYSIKEPDTLDWLDRMKPDSVYFDIGANIGQYSVYPAKKYGETLRIFAFEPQSNNYFSLNRNIYLNNMKNCIFAYCIGIGGKSGFDKLYVPKFVPGGNRSQLGQESLEAMRSPTTHIQGMFGVTLDDLCEKWEFPFPNYLKIDVDGIEIQILRAATNVLKNPALWSVIVELETDEEQKEATAIMHTAGMKLTMKSTGNWGETCCIFERA